MLSVSMDGELGRDETTRRAARAVIASDPTCDPIGKTNKAYWRVRS
jgi:hypothetical protein